MVEQFQFVGRVHPLVVHLPIGILCLLAMLELVGWRWPALRLSPGLRLLVLAGATASAAVAAGCGWLLAAGGSFDPTLLELHRWLGIATVVGSVLLLILSRRPKPYGFVLTASLVSLTLAGHHGGALTHGRSYLADAAPAFLRPYLGGGAPTRVPPSSLAVADVYDDLVSPILAARCASCHGAGKSDGNLRLDSFAALVEGGKHGAAIDRAAPEESLLLRRLLLPLDAKEHMPPAGRPQPTDDEMAILGWWLDQGAPERGSVTGLLRGPAASEAISRYIGLPLPRPPDRPTILATAAQLEKNLGVTIASLSPDQPWLAINARLRGRAFGDEQLTALAAVAPAVHRLDLGGTAITDAGLARLAGMNELRRLQLDETAITDAGLVHLSSLKRLESLGLHSTNVTDAGLKPLEGLSRLRRIYLWQTAVTPAGARALASAVEDSRRLRRYRSEALTWKNKLDGEQFQADFGATATAAAPPPETTSAKDDR